MSRPPPRPDLAEGISNVGEAPNLQQHKLVLFDGPDANHSTKIPPLRYRFGRDEGCDRGDGVTSRRRGKFPNLSRLPQIRRVDFASGESNFAYHYLNKY